MVSMRGEGLRLEVGAALPELDHDDGWQPLVLTCQGVCCGWLAMGSRSCWHPSCAMLGNDDPWLCVVIVLGHVMCGG